METKDVINMKRIRQGLPPIMHDKYVDMSYFPSEPIITQEQEEMKIILPKAEEHVVQTPKKEDKKEQKKELVSETKLTEEIIVPQTVEPVNEKTDVVEKKVQKKHTSKK